ncbi:MAG TPA: type VI secretion system ImpA family N-terminal domain-containing protein [Roseateles sp.]|nr:type VI secretion system ImpA family N-terminal domain-containing protein [Roseateles sp.]
MTHLLQTLSGGLMPPSLAVDVPEPWLHPVAPDAPSGPSLEYDPEFAVLAARLAPKAEVQYGRFTAAPPEPDWKDIERDCRRLLLRSKDLNLLLWFTRSRTSQAGALGLLQGLCALQQVCERFGDTVHPQLHIEGHFEPLVRANTLAGLCDPEGLLREVRELVIVPGTAQRLKVRDVERAFAVPRPAQALEPQAVQRQLDDLSRRRDEPLLALQACAACVQSLQSWAERSLADEAPNLKPLMDLLRPLLGATSPRLPLPGTAPPAPVDTAAAATPAEDALAPSPQPPAPTAALPMPGAGVHSRDDVRAVLAQARTWIEAHEPSSPILPLLKQAERMWGRRFSEIAHMVPPELLRAWDQDD